MRFVDEIQRMIDGMPTGSLISLPVDWLRARLDEVGGHDGRDFTVEEVASLFDRSPTTVRAWIREGDLRAYRLRGAEYRIPRAAVDEFREAQERRYSTTSPL